MLATEFGVGGGKDGVVVGVVENLYALNADRVLVYLSNLVHEPHDHVVIDLLMIGTGREIDRQHIRVEEEARLQRIHDQAAPRGEAASHAVGTDRLGSAPLEEPATARNPEDSARSERERHDQSPASPSLRLAIFISVFRVDSIAYS